MITTPSLPAEWVELCRRKDEVRVEGQQGPLQSGPNAVLLGPEARAELARLKDREEVVGPWVFMRALSKIQADMMRPIR